MYLVASFQVNIATLPWQDQDTAPTDISYFDVTEQRDLADIAHDPLVLFSVPTIA